MEIVIAGSSGLIGTALRRSLSAAGHRPIRLVRRPPQPGTDEIEWDPAAGRLDAEAISGTDAVINLAGAGIGDHRWTDEYRRTLVDSRTDTTSLLAKACAASAEPPSVFLGGSAVGYYGNRGAEVLTEQSSRGQGFLADLVEAWEASAKPAIDAGIRTCFLRTGSLVLAAKGGALPKFLPLFKLGLGGKFGSGDQYFSWISIDDEVAAIEFLLGNDSISGPVNLTAPNPVTNAEFTEALADVLNRPAFLPVPAFAARLLLGADRADSLLFEGQRVEPGVLVDNGFTFQHPTVTEALRHVLG
ncbi:MAG: TIGR01777 family oxidoreductase [Acidimicrobiia bacterium]|nr:TIGR01777 family oxidoreductase [Acidimicrobiia bacterium]